MQTIDMGTSESKGLKPEPLPFHEESGCQPKYFPPVFVGSSDNCPETLYCCYLIQLNQYCYKRTQLHNVILALRTRLEEKLTFDLNVQGANWVGQLLYIGDVKLSIEEKLRCQRFQVTLFRVLFDNNLNRLGEALGRFIHIDGSVVVDYLLLPSTGPIEGPLIDWKIIASVLFPYEKSKDKHSDDCSRHGCSPMHTKNGLLFSCLLENSLVWTPHNNFLYCITGILDHLNGGSVLKKSGEESITYKDYFKKKHGIDLCFETELFLSGKNIPKVKNFLYRPEVDQKTREPSNFSVQLPPELCAVIMSPLPMATFYSFSFLPSIMHRVESLLIASCLKKMCMEHFAKNVIMPTPKILEAITTNLCIENFHLESLETLGDSFLKYASSQQVFKTYQNDQEGPLTEKRGEMTSNTHLYKLACDRKIPGFIRNEQLDPKTWVVPGDYSTDNNLGEEFVSTTGKIYRRGKRNMKNKMIADVVEALIGAFLSEAGEKAAVSFMQWLGLDIDFVNVPIIRSFPVNAQKLIDIKRLESASLLNYEFFDPSLLVEALTHASYMLHGIPSYQRLEFLGDAVLDYVITAHLYYKYPGLSPGDLTELRSASVNNCCYALSAVKAGLHKHILLSSTSLQSFINDAVQDFELLSSSYSTFGWELDTSFPKVLSDIIESIAGAVFLDSCLRTDIVFEKIRPLLEPMVTLESLRSHPVKELRELCQKRRYIMKSPVETFENGEAHVVVEVVANGVVYEGSSSARGKKIALRLACKNLLKLLKPEAGA